MHAWKISLDYEIPLNVKKTGTSIIKCWGIKSWLQYNLTCHYCCSINSRKIPQIQCHSQIGTRMFTKPCLKEKR